MQYFLIRKKLFLRLFDHINRLVVQLLWTIHEVQRFRKFLLSYEKIDTSLYGKVVDYSPTKRLYLLLVVLTFRYTMYSRNAPRSHLLLI
jgi:hypothetical protein